MDYSLKEYNDIYDALLLSNIKGKTLKQFSSLELPPDVGNLLRKLVQNILPNLINL